MRRKGHADSTVEGTIRGLKGLAKHVNLLHQDNLLTHLNQLNVSNSRKERLVIYLAHFYEYKQLPFTPPRYKRVEKLPFIPTEEEIDQLISGVGKKTACFLQTLKETGARPGEAWNLKWIDVDMQQRILTINSPEKGSHARRLQISTRLATMLNNQPRKYDYIFRNPATELNHSMDHWRNNYVRRRKRLALKPQTPRIKQISFKTLRHFAATKLYHQTKDILHVMRFLGHKSIKNTLVYTHLVNWESDDYICKVATILTEAEALIEAGFEYVTEMEGKKLFRKRK